MKKKDVITLAISIIVFITTGYFGYRMLFPPKPNSQATNQGFVIEEKQKFTGEIDDDTLNEVKKLRDYGEGTLENIGRTNPFGPI